MKNSSKLIVSLSAPFLLALSASAAVSSVSSSFGDSPEDGAVVTTGALGWGYISVDGSLGGSNTYSDSDFSSINSGSVITTVDSGYSVGDVLITTDGNGVSTRTDATGPAYTFDGTAAHGRIGDVAPVEDVFTFDFNDLGIGTFDITLYLGHSAGDRTFDMDYEFFENGSSTGAAVTTATPGDLDSFTTWDQNGQNLFSYTISFTTTEADTDLALSWASTGGGGGDAYFAGYVINGTTIPEPSSYALLSGLLALSAIMLRRR